MAKSLMKNTLLVAVLLACLAPRLAVAGLSGDPAPPLNVSQWLLGKPVEIKPGTNIYVVEIWNSDRESCRASITNLNDIQRTFGTNGVTVVAVSDEPIAKLKTFVDEQGSNIAFTVASDNRRYTSLTYMNPVMERQIPYAFVVGTNGDLLWHGSPFQGLEAIVELVTAGAYDEELAKKEDLDQHHMAQYLMTARQGGDRVGQAGQNLLAERTNSAGLLISMAYEISTAPHLAKRDFPLAGQALDRAQQLEVTNTLALATARAIWLFESGKQDEGLAKAQEALVMAKTPAQQKVIKSYIRNMQSRRLLNTNPDNSPAALSNSSQTNTNQSGQGANPGGKP
jgi:hypothetical protein